MEDDVLLLLGLFLIVNFALTVEALILAMVGM